MKQHKSYGQQALDEFDSTMRKGTRIFAVLLLVIASALLFLYIIPYWLVSMGEPYSKMFNSYYSTIDALRVLSAVCISVSYILLGIAILILEKKTRRRNESS